MGAIFSCDEVDMVKTVHTGRQKNMICSTGGFWTSDSVDGSCHHWLMISDLCNDRRRLTSDTLGSLTSASRASKVTPKGNHAPGLPIAGQAYTSIAARYLEISTLNRPHEVVHFKATRTRAMGPLWLTNWSLRLARMSVFNQSKGGFEER